MKRTEKRIRRIAILCVAVLCLSILPAGAFAGETQADAARQTTEGEAELTSENSPVVLQVYDEKTGQLKREYTIQDFTDLEFDDAFPITDGNTEGLVYQKFSSRSQNPITPYSWYGVAGVTVEWLLRDLGIWNTFTEVTFLTEDNISYSMEREDIENPEGYYYTDSAESAEKVYPMLGLWYTETEGTKDGYLDPGVPEILETGLSDSAPRLFLGQSYYDEGNAGGYLKYVIRVIADFPPDDLYNIPPEFSDVPEDIYLTQGQQFQYPADPAATDAYGYSVGVTRSVLSEDGTKDYVDVNTPGTYIITYRAEDSRGNTAEVEVRVYVTENFVQQGIYNVTIANGSGYTVSETSDKSPAELTATASGILRFSVKISPEKRYGTQQTVLFVQYRGDKMVSLSSQKLSLSTAKTLSGSFSAESGDSVRIFVLTDFDAEKGTATYLLNGR